MAEGRSSLEFDRNPFCDSNPNYKNPRLGLPKRRFHFWSTSQNLYTLSVRWQSFVTVQDDTNLWALTFLPDAQTFLSGRQRSLWKELRLFWQLVSSNPQQVLAIQRRENAGISPDNDRNYFQTALLWFRIRVSDSCTNVRSCATRTKYLSAHQSYSVVNTFYLRYWASRPQTQLKLDGVKDRFILAEQLRGPAACYEINHL